MAYATNEHFASDLVRSDSRMDELPVAVVEVGRDGRVSYVNRRFEEQASIAALDVVGRDMTEVIDVPLPFEGNRGAQWATLRVGAESLPDPERPDTTDSRPLVQLEWVRTGSVVLMVLTWPERASQRAVVQALHAVRAAERLLRNAAHPAHDEQLSSGANRSGGECAPTSSLRIPGAKNGDGVSQRESEILRSLLKGRTVVQVAEALQLSVHTVRNHLKSIYRKLRVHSREELFASFLPQGGDFEAHSALDNDFGEATPE